MSPELVSHILLVLMIAHTIGIFFALRHNHKRLNQVAVDIHEVKDATDGMKDELVKTTKKAALLQGDKEGRADMKAEQAAGQ